VLDAMQTRDELYAVLDYHTYEQADNLFATSAGPKTQPARKRAGRRARKG
jgi:hypothetical protein